MKIQEIKAKDLKARKFIEEKVREIREMAYMGASVFHDEAILPVREAGIPIRIKNTNRPDEPGTLITATILGDESTFLIGSREIVGDSDLEVYSEGSPLGTAIIGMKVGDETSYTAPNGKSIDVKIVKVETYVP